jgi:hypothetical protein
MANVGVGEAIYSLRRKIQQIHLELDMLNDSLKEIPELISSANLLRRNEHLLKLNEKKSELLSVYKQYSESLEDMLSAVFEIQGDLKNILKEQSSLISSKKTSKPKRSKPKSKKSTKK